MRTYQSSRRKDFISVGDFQQQKITNMKRTVLSTKVYQQPQYQKGMKDSRDHNNYVSV